MSAEIETSQEATTTAAEAQPEQQTQQPVADAKPESTQPQAESKPEGEQEQTERDEKGRFKGVQPRIDELTRARREAEREAAYWRNVAQGSKGSAEPAVPQKPTPDKFSDYAEYVEALTDWKAEAVVTKRFTEQAQARADETRATTWQERQDKVRESMPDYDDVLAMADTPLANHVREVLVESDQGPALAYHLAKHPDTLMRLNGLAPLQAAREIGRIEASLASKPVAEATPARTTQAPKPAGVSSSQGRTTSVDPTKMSMDEYMTHRKQQGARWSR